ncbi:hypothetical protein L209DRAFT_758096 [Thermothelomyces heterothallicus CBS 203.75]
MQGEGSTAPGQLPGRVVHEPQEPSHRSPGPGRARQSGKACGGSPNSNSCIRF